MAVVPTWEEYETYFEHNAKQGTEDWLRARKGRVTSSICGALVGHSNLKTSKDAGLIIAGQLIEEFKEENQQYMNHGKETEAVARAWYCQKYNCSVKERNLIVPKWDYRLGASIDGEVIGQDTIIEIKCPQKMYSGISLYMDNCAAGWKPPANYIGHILRTHYDQMQLCMKVLNKKYCDYIVFCTFTKECFTQRIEFDHIYWTNNLYPDIIKNYSYYVEPYFNYKDLLCPV